MKYFKERRKKSSSQKSESLRPSALSEAMAEAFTFSPYDGRGADGLPENEFKAETHEQSSNHLEKESVRCRELPRSCENLICARRRKDVRLTRKEVSCLQHVVRTVLNEHLVLSRELQAVQARIGLTTDNEPMETKNDVSSLSRDVERLQTALDRDAAALRDREERLEGALADAATLRLELEKCQQDSAMETEKSKTLLNQTLAERDKALKTAVEKDQVISNLRSELADLQSKRSNEVLSMSRDLTDKEVYIKKLLNQVQECAAGMAMLEAEVNEKVALLEMERTVRRSTENNLETLRWDLKTARDDQEETAIMLSNVISGKEQESEDLRKQLEETKEEFEHNLAEATRMAEARITEIKHNGEKAVAQKAVELHNAECKLKQAEAEILRLRGELESEKNKHAVSLGELAAARNEIANCKKSAAGASNQAAELQSELAHERLSHHQEMQKCTAAFDEQIKSLQTNFDERLSQLNEEGATEKANLKRELALVKEKWARTEVIASRVPTLESNLKGAQDEISTFQRKNTERSAELALKRQEMKELSEQLTNTRQEMEKMRTKQNEEVKKLKDELQNLKDRAEQDADHFRKALHEKDLEIRTGQDVIKDLKMDQAKAEKDLNDATIKHKVSMSNSKAAHKETVSNLKQQIMKKTEEINSLKETVKGLQAKMIEQTDKLKASSEKTKTSLEKKIKEKEALLKESEEKRANLSSELSDTLKSKEATLKELNRVRNDLKRTMDILCEARAETRLALDTMADTERAMTLVYAENKVVLTTSQSQIEELEKKWCDAKKDAEQRRNLYNRLKVRFVKYIKLQEDELKAAGDSVQQNKAEAQRYLDDLKRSKTELASKEERCQSLKSELDLALRQAANLAENENALTAQAEQNKQMLSRVVSEVEMLRNNLSRQNSDLVQLKNELAEKTSELEMVNADLENERAISAKQSAECQNAFALIESVSSEGGLVLDPEVKLPERVDMLLQNIQKLESRLQELNLQYQTVKEEHELLKAEHRTLREEHEALQQELASKMTEINEFERLLVCKDESIGKLRLELTNLHQGMSAQQSKIAELEKNLEEVQAQARSALGNQGAFKRELEEEKYVLNDANSRIERLTNQLGYERSRVGQLEQDLARAVKAQKSYQDELNAKASNIKDLSISLDRMQSELNSQEDLTKTLEERTDEAASLQQRLSERDGEISRLLNLLEQAHVECDCKNHYESANGDGNKETQSDGLRELKTSLTDRDCDVTKLWSVVVELQEKLSTSKSTSDEEIALYRYRVEELSNEITSLRHQLEQETSMKNSAKLDLHLTAEQTQLGGRRGVSRTSPRRRPGAPGGAPLKRTVSEGNSERVEPDDSSAILVPMSTDTQA